MILYYLLKLHITIEVFFIVINIYRYIDNLTIETIIGIGSFLLIFILLKKLTK